MDNGHVNAAMIGTHSISSIFHLGMPCTDVYSGHRSSNNVIKNKNKKETQLGVSKSLPNGHLRRCFALEGGPRSKEKGRRCGSHFAWVSIAGDSGCACL
jgi:hypothetical protein